MPSELQMSDFLNKVENLYETKFILNEVVLDAWQTAFAYCDVTILERALQKWIETSPKTPTIADIKTIALQMCGGSFYRKEEVPDSGLYNDPDTCKVIFFDETLPRHLSTRVARRFLLQDSTGKYFYPLLGDNQEVIFNS